MFNPIREAKAILRRPELLLDDSDAYLAPECWLPSDFELAYRLLPEPEQFDFDGSQRELEF